MTCDDFRKNGATVESFLKLTRAERSATGQHWTTCFECRQWSANITYEYTIEQALTIVQLKHQDQQDPETFFISPEEADKFDLDKESTDATTTRNNQSNMEGR